MKCIITRYENGCRYFIVICDYTTFTVSLGKYLPSKRKAIFSFSQDFCMCEKLVRNLANYTTAAASASPFVFYLTIIALLPDGRSL